METRPSNERRTDDCESFDMECKDEDSFVSSSCKSPPVKNPMIKLGLSPDKTSINGTSKTIVQNKDLKANVDAEKTVGSQVKTDLLNAEKTVGSQEKSVVPTNGDESKVQQNGSVSNGLTTAHCRHSPAPSSVSESEDLKLYHSCNYEEDPKSLATENGDRDVESPGSDKDGDVPNEEPMEKESFHMDCEDEDSFVSSSCKSPPVKNPMIKLGLSPDKTSINGTNKTIVQNKDLKANVDAEKTVGSQVKTDLLNAEKTVGSQEKSVVPTNGDESKVQQNGSVSNGLTTAHCRHSPAPSSVSESEDLKLCHSCNYEEDPKSLATENGDRDVESPGSDKDGDVPNEEPMEMKQSELGTSAVPNDDDKKEVPECDVVAETEQENRSSKRSLDTDTAVKTNENEPKKMKIDDQPKVSKNTDDTKNTDDASSEVVSTDDIDLSSRLKMNSLSEEASKQEKTKQQEKVQGAAKSMSKNFFNLNLTKDQLSAIGDVTRMSKADLKKLVFSKTLETLSLRSKLAASYHEVKIMTEKVAEYKQKIQPLKKQLNDLSNVLTHVNSQLVKSGKCVRPKKIIRSVGLQVNVNGCTNMTPQMSANAPPVRQGVKTLRPVQRPPATLANQSPQAPNPRPAVAPVSQQREVPKTLRVALPGSNLRTSSQNILTSSSPAAAASPRMPAPSPPAMAKVNQVMPTISAVPMSNLQPQNTSVVLSRQNSRCIDLTSIEDGSGIRTAQVGPSVSSGQQVSFMQNSKFSIIPQQGMAKPVATPVAYLVQGPQSRPVLLTPTGQPTSQSLNSLNLNSVQWVKNMQTNVVGNQTQNMIRPLNTTTNIRPNQMAVHSTPQGLQRGALYTVGPTVASIQRNLPYLPNRIQHPAPLPVVAPHPPSRPGWRLPPPKPILKISKIQNGIVLSWNMSVSGSYEDMKSYQIYAYQETKDPPSSSLWKTVGDVKALALPMACTLTQFKEGHKYHFSVRAVDIHSRMGPNSDPTSIVLVK